MGAAFDGASGALVEINSETDFVARNEDFQNFVAAAAEASRSVGGDLEALKTAPQRARARRHCRRSYRPRGQDRREPGLAAQRRALGRVRGRGGFTFTIRCVPAWDASESWSPCVPRRRRKALTALGKNLAMHVAAARPQVLDRESVGPGNARTRARRRCRSGAGERQARSGDRQDHRRPHEEVVPGDRAGRAASTSSTTSRAWAKRSKPRRKAAGAPIEIGRLPALRTRRGSREATDRLRRRSRGPGRRELKAARGGARRPGHDRRRGRRVRRAPFPPRVAETVGRSVDGRSRLRPRRRGRLGRCAEDIRRVRRMGVEVCIVVGGGNIFRGLAGAAAGDRPG